MLAVFVVLLYIPFVCEPDDVTTEFIMLSIIFLLMFCLPKVPLLWKLHGLTCNEGTAKNCYYQLHASNNKGRRDYTLSKRVASHCQTSNFSCSNRRLQVLPTNCSPGELQVDILRTTLPGSVPKTSRTQNSFQSYSSHLMFIQLHMVLA